MLLSSYRILYQLLPLLCTVMALLAVIKPEVPEKSLKVVTAWLEVLLFTITYSRRAVLAAEGNVMVTAPAAGPIIMV